MDNTISVLEDGRKYYREVGPTTGARVDELVQAIQTRLDGVIERTMHMEDCLVSVIRVEGHKITVYWGYTNPSKPFIEVRAGAVDANKVLERIYWGMGPYSAGGVGAVTR